MIKYITRGKNKGAKRSVDLIINKNLKNSNMIIKVTTEDIANGKTGGIFCPVAQACQREYKNPSIVVSSNIICFRNQNFSIKKLPPKAKQFIKDFDSDLPVKPFQFNLE